MFIIKQVLFILLFSNVDIIDNFFIHGQAISLEVAAAATWTLVEKLNKQKGNQAEAKQG